MLIDLPLIAIYKKVYGQNEVFITPTIEEVKSLLPANAEIIAVDATKRPRPDNKTLKEFYKEIRQIYNGLIMADISDTRGFGFLYADFRVQGFGENSPITGSLLYLCPERHHLMF